MHALVDRSFLKNTRRIVIKVGTRVLLQPFGEPDLTLIARLVSEMSQKRAHGYEIIFVSSGAIGAGMQVLSLKKRPSSLPMLQMAAAVGQTRLMASYEDFFSKRGCTVSQVLLTHDDLRHRVRHLNARNTMMQLLEHKIVPIVNENDVVAVDEIKFGDNDILASLVAMLVDADLLLMLTTTDGVYDEDGKRISAIKSVSKKVLSLVHDKANELSSGGMLSKLMAARNVVRAGGLCVIADGKKQDVIARVLDGSDTGTVIGDPEQRERLNSRKKWLGFFNRSKGAVYVDDGAARAVTLMGKSLLAAGIVRVEGQFDKGALVDVRALDGSVIARGLVDYSCDDIELIKGQASKQFVHILGTKDYDEVIHRDNMFVEQASKDD